MSNVVFVNTYNQLGVTWSYRSNLDRLVGNMLHGEDVNDLLVRSCLLVGNMLGMRL